MKKINVSLVVFSLLCLPQSWAETEKAASPNVTAGGGSVASSSTSGAAVAGTNAGAKATSTSSTAAATGPYKYTFTPNSTSYKSVSATTSYSNLAVINGIQIPVAASNPFSVYWVFNHDDVIENIYWTDWTLQADTAAQVLINTPLSRISYLEIRCVEPAQQFTENGTYNYYEMGVVNGPGSTVKKQKCVISNFTTNVPN